MTDNTKKTAGMTAIHHRSAFLLDDRSIQAHLDDFRQYCQRLPFVVDTLSPGATSPNWAQVLLGREAGEWEPGLPNPSLSQTSEVAWARERERLAQLYDAPELADGQMPPEQAFLLSLLGMLETPRALLNQLPAQHRSLYYQKMLKLGARMAQADRVTVHFTLADGAREHVLPTGLLLDAGQDSAGNALRYALTQPLTANTARITDLRWVVRDLCVPGGQRARTVLDETAGLGWPKAGVRLFGASPSKAGEAARVDADRIVERGRIVESPVLAVAGGTRTWTVTLESALSGKGKGALRAAVSMDDVWVSVPCILDGGGKVLTVTLSADGGVPTAVKALDGLVSTAPLLRLTSVTGQFVPKVKTLGVVVAEATDVTCVRDDGTLLSGGGLPFGETADVGKGINLVSPAWWRLGDKLTQVTLTPSWSGLPTVSFPVWYGPDKAQTQADWLLLDPALNVTTDNMKGRSPLHLAELGGATLAGRVTNGADIARQIHVDAGYPSVSSKTLASNDYFKVKAAPHRQGKQPGEHSVDLSLFGGSAAPEGQSLSITLNNVPAAAPAAPLPDVKAPAQWPWCVRLSLSTSFLHNEYAAHERAALQTVMFLTEQKTVHQVPVMVVADKNSDEKVHKMVTVNNPNDKGKTMLMPAMRDETVSIVTPVAVTVPKAKWNPPYVPQWSGVRIDYQAVDTQVVQRVIMPFGYAPHDASPTLLEDAEAEMYLGLEGIEAEQLLTLHWQLKSPCALQLEWHYLAAGERWSRLPVSDGTDGGHRSGILSIDWPGDVSQTSTSLPTGRLWLRGRVKQLPERDATLVALPTTPWLTGMVTNAAQAVLVAPQAVQATHFDTGLPAGRITQVLDAPETVQSVAQPWVSTGGRAAETQAVFEARVARRLRHRERGLNNIDLMMLLQERYDGIRELAVLPSSPGPNRALQQTIVVMPDPALSDSDDVCRPGLSSQHLAAMAKALQPATSPWLVLKCVNPHYISVRVSWDVTYVPGLSHSMGYARVKAALEGAFMSWCLTPEGGDERVIGRPVTHSAVRDVLRRVPEVAAVSNVYLNGHIKEELTMNADQVAVLTCIPLEYTGLALAWQDAKKQRFGELILEGGAEAVVRVTVPQSVLGLGDEPIATSVDKVYLVDLETGLPLPTTQKTGASLWVTKVNALSGPQKEGKAKYAEPYGNEPVSTLLNSLHFKVNTAAETCGVFRVAVAMALTKPDVILQSSVVGECLLLRLQSSMT